MNTQKPSCLLSSKRAIQFWLLNDENKNQNEILVKQVIIESLKKIVFIKLGCNLKRLSMTSLNHRY